MGACVFNIYTSLLNFTLISSAACGMPNDRAKYLLLFACRASTRKQRVFQNEKRCRPCKQYSQPSATF